MIEVESNPGCGTCIRVHLPAIEPPSSGQTSTRHSSIAPFPRQAGALAALPCSGEVVRESDGKTILLVDDDAPARKSMQGILRDAGYRILAASSGKQALKVFAEYSGAVDLLIADFRMPGMNGQEVAETLLGQMPGLKVLMISGYEHSPDESAADAFERIRKPFSGRSLIERVVEVIHSP